MRKHLCLLLIPAFMISGLFAKEKDAFTADYVIIGSGPAGAPIAKLLTDSKKHSAILLEAGENHSDNPLIKYTNDLPEVVFNRTAEFFLETSTIAQKNLDNRQFDWTSGRVLGGASSINGTFWVRGTDQLFSKWQQFGGKKWSLSRINRIFKYIENYHGETPNPEFRGYHGPVSVRQPQATVPSGVKFAEAIQEALGFPILQDYNDPLTPLGTDPRVQWTQRGPNGKYRVSSATSFLHKGVVTKKGRGVKGRKLQVLTKSTALRIIWDGNKAIGVHALRNGKEIKVFARKKVIVSSGINSSQFLQVSGIGPKSELKRLDIPVVFDNPNVGLGVQDNLGVVTLWSINPNDPVNPPGDPADIASFLSFLPDPSGQNPTERSIQLVSRVVAPGALTVGVILCNEKSTGKVGLFSSDPLHVAKVDLGIFTNPYDIETYKLAFRNYILPIATQIASIDPTYQLLVPDETIINDDDLLTEFLTNAVDIPSTVHNYTTHCKMAPFEEGGVVDGRGRVYGVKNLVVADCSIAPTTTDGACQAMGYMIGVNIALQILEEEGECKKL